MADVYEDGDDPPPSAAARPRNPAAEERRLESLVRRHVADEATVGAFAGMGQGFFAAARERLAQPRPGAAPQDGLETPGRSDETGVLARHRRLVEAANLDRQAAAERRRAAVRDGRWEDLQALREEQRAAAQRASRKQQAAIELEGRRRAQRFAQKAVRPAGGCDGAAVKRARLSFAAEDGGGDAEEEPPG
ncbi:unnamed protein product [Prorocentrum cordatum]|uniref:Uncharacterized protein n=1 Tax=Prorocentrum cordatum TaxID=2364126 RepID=A0ABN9THV1_9DINO|nr:unnamed protein product [Polarella glacialis]